MISGLGIRPSFNTMLWGFGTCRGLEEQWIERAVSALYHKYWKLCVAGLEEQYQRWVPESENPGFSDLCDTGDLRYSSAWSHALSWLVLGTALWPALWHWWARTLVLAVDRTVITETAGKIDLHISRGSPHWCLALTAGGRSPWLTVHMCVHMCVFSLTQLTSHLDQLKSSALCCQHVPWSFPATLATNYTNLLPFSTLLTTSRNNKTFYQYLHGFWNLQARI